MMQQPETKVNSEKLTRAMSDFGTTMEGLGSAAADARGALPRWFDAYQSFLAAELRRRRATAKPQK